MDNKLLELLASDLRAANVISDNELKELVKLITEQNRGVPDDVKKGESDVEF